MVKKLIYIFSLLLLVSGLIFISGPATAWLHDFEEAKKEAREKHRPLLLYFSGSDWCSSCIRLKKEVYETEAFSQYATEKLVLLNADFPRMKKHKPEKQLQQQNESLAGKYNPKGIFPYTLLMDEEGRVMKTWEGYNGMSPEDFIRELERYGRPNNAK